MGGVTDIIVVMLILGGLYIFIKSGKLQELTQGGLQLPPIQLPGSPAPAPQQQPTPTPVPGGGTEGGPGEGGGEQGGATVSSGGQGGQFPVTQCPGGPSDRAQWCAKHPCLAQQGEEIGGYLTILRGDDDVSIKMRGGAHSDDCPNSGCCYIVGVSYSGGEHHSIECPHPSSDGDIEGGGALFSPGNLIGKTFGIMARCYPVGGADKLEVWLDVSNNGQFRKFWEGTSSRFSGKCNGVSGGCADRGELTFIRLDDVGGYSGAKLERAWCKTYSGGAAAGNTIVGKQRIFRSHRASVQTKQLMAPRSTV